MNPPEEIKRIRQRSFLAQQGFVSKIGMAFSTVDRWELGHTKPGLKATKSINAFYLEHSFPYKTVEQARFDYRTEK